MKFTAAKESYIKSCTATGKSAATIASYSATLEKFAAFIAEQGIEAAEDVRPMTIMGYIEQRSGEVWQLLTEVKRDFGRFADTLEKTRQRLQQASESMDSAFSRTQAIRRRLSAVESLEEIQPKIEQEETS